MTVDQKRKTLCRIAECQHDIAELKRVRMELGISATASATVSGGTGSKSYTRLDLAKINELIATLSRELVQLRNLLAGKSANPIERHYICWG